MNGPLAEAKGGRASIPGQSTEELSARLANRSIGALERLSPPAHPALAAPGWDIHTALIAHLLPKAFLDENNRTCLELVISMCVNVFLAC